MFRMLIGTVCIWLSVGQGWAAEGVLTILHTNQIHGRFEQVMKVGALKLQVEKEAGAVLLLDAGDAFAQEESAFAHPEGKVSPTVDLMTRAGYDAWVLGKSETQTDPNFLSQALRNAQFPVLGANLHRPANGRFLFQVQPYTVVMAGGFRVGILGLAHGATQVGTGNPTLAAQYYVPFIKTQADVVVLLTNLDFAADSTLAMQLPDVDLIVGSYSDDQPRTQTEVNGVAIRRSAPYGQAAGRIELRVSNDRVVVQNTQMIPLDIPLGSIDAMTVALSAWTLPLNGESLSVNATLGNSAGGFGASIGQAGAMGYLMADLMQTATSADVALISAKSLDSELPEGPIQVSDIYRIYGSDDRLVVIEMKGEELHQLMENGLDDLNSFFYPAGLRVVYDLMNVKGKRLVSLMDGQRRPLNLRKTFKVAVESNAAQFIDKDRVIKRGKIRDIFAKHVRDAGVIQGRLDDRLQER